MRNPTLYRALYGSSIRSKPWAQEDQGIGHNTNFQLRLHRGRQSAAAAFLAIHRTLLIMAIRWPEAAASQTPLCLGLGNLKGLNKTLLTEFTLIRTLWVNGRDLRGAAFQWPLGKMKGLVTFQGFEPLATHSNALVGRQASTWGCWCRIAFKSTPEATALGASSTLCWLWHKFWSSWGYCSPHNKLSNNRGLW